MRVVDLFAGAYSRLEPVVVVPITKVHFCTGLGGFTCGAIEAGAEVILVVDSDPSPLRVLAANAPSATAVVATLGEGRDEVQLPPPASDLHVHFSTPCTELSVARRGDDKANIEGGLSMIKWAVQLVLERGDHSWSLEQVPTKATRSLITELATAHPEQIAYGVFDSADFGAPQTRLRLIAGPPRLIRMLQAIPCARHVSIRDAFEKVGAEVPAPRCKNQTRSQAGGEPTMRNVETQSFTVCAGHALTWCDTVGKTVRVMTARESAYLMGFPSTWTLPHGSRAAQRAVGNAMCVSLSSAIMRSAIAVQTGNVSVLNEVNTEPKHSPAPTEKSVPTRQQYRRLRRRIDNLEKLVYSTMHFGEVLED